VPAAPLNVVATAGDTSATVSWTAPNNGGSPITSYTVTPWIGTTAQPATVVGVTTMAAIQSAGRRKVRPASFMCRIEGITPSMGIFAAATPPTSTTITGLTNGTTYTFTVTATNAIGTGPASVASNAVTPQAPVAPGAPTSVSAVAGNGSASVSWTAPASNGGSPITSYTVTPYVGSVAQTTTVVPGSPPATTATINGLTNGTTYTFTVTATNAVGSGPASAPSNGVTPTATVVPAFVQGLGAHATSKASLAVTPASSVAAGDRLVVEVGVWSGGNATAAKVADSAGDTFVELTHFTGSDHTEMSVWSAPVTAGGGTRPTVTVTPSATADIGMAVLEYSGLSTVSDATVADVSAEASGKTTSAAAVSSGSTPATTSGNELALGLYVDSGFGDTLGAGPGYTGRVNVSNAGDIELLAEDAVVGQGANPAASITTGASTVWLAETLVLKHG
jgi:hypothetical protein